MRDIEKNVDENVDFIHRSPINIYGFSTALLFSLSIICNNYSWFILGKGCVKVPILCHGKHSKSK